MQHITTHYRWATLLDQSVYVEAWQLGAQWADSSSCIHQIDSTSTPMSAFDSSSLVDPENLGPLQPAQQSTKHDLSSPVP
jgi:hypothetical protein